MDGDIDYSKYSRDELNEALSRIDKRRYPRNYAKIVEEAGARPVAPAPTQRPGNLGKWVVRIGWYQLACSLIFAHKALTSDLSSLSSIENISWVVVVLFGLAILTAAAGFLTVRGHRLGVYLSIASFAFQAVALSVPGFSYQYAPLVGLHLFWANENFGFTGFIGPDSKIGVGGSYSTYVAIDAIAVVALFVLIKYARGRDTSS